MDKPTEDQNRLQAESIHAAIQATSEIDFPEGTLLVGWALVADWVTPAGERRLLRLGPVDQPAWVKDGLLHAGLDCYRWPDPD